MQLHYEAKVFLLFHSFFEPPNSTKNNRDLRLCFLTSFIKILHLPWLQSFELSVCFMLPSVPTPQNVPQITIVSSRLNKAFHDKTAGHQSAPKKGLITNLNSPLLGAQMSYRMRRTTIFHLAKIHHIYFSLVSWPPGSFTCSTAV